ncbi:SPOR domain-containing protein [Cellvibrio sp. OA-2007]|uniref:SPOR domain-containing protein n=1 Tax=Cellvibrio sp. OA-2007 TaxID=529823 RepID=UPI0007813E3C|nr:hypothetical protein [Cellvibrio sp. OA-2007]
MRAIFILLIVGNIAFFGYHYFFMVEKEVVAGVQVGAARGSAGEGLQLLSEVVDPKGARARVKETRVIEGAVASDSSSGAELCTMIGPYGQLLQAEYAVERLVALGAPAHIIPIEIKEGEIYWVFLKPEVSEKEALRRLYELQKKNIESYVITKGELTNGISFGRFADYGEAEARSAEIKQQGYEVYIKMLPKMIQETWVVIDAGFAEKIDETVWSGLLMQESNLEKRQNFCLGVASQ